MQIDVQGFLNQGAFLDFSATHVVVGWGERQSAPAPHPQGWSFWAQSFHDLEPSTPWVVFEHTEVIEKQKLSDAVASQSRQSPANAVSVRVPQPDRRSESDPVSGHPSRRIWTPLDHVRYQTQFEMAQMAFRSGEAKKLVLYEVSETTDTVGLKLQAIQHALGHGHLHPFGIWDSTAGWVGATPETLCWFKSPGYVAVDALAGTVPVERRTELLHDPKLLEEQQMVVEDIVAEISDLGQVQVGPREIYQAPPLAHLRTEVTLHTSPDVTWSAVVKKLHPTAAVGGWPRSVAQQFLRHWDHLLPRGRYGAPIGAYHPQHPSRCFVGLRGVQWSGDGAQIFVGGGVTAQSTLDAEFAELQAKLTAVRRWLGV
jgi:menaquinone-specific isochorismate synthase